MLSGEHFSADFVDRFLNVGFASTNISDRSRCQLDETFRAGADFFTADIRHKMSAQLPLDTGYRPLGIEYSRSPDTPDEMESFSISHRLPACEQILPSRLAENLRQDMLKLFDTIEPMVEDLTSRIASCLTGRPLAKGLHGSFRNWSLLQLNYSLPSLATNEHINELHEDGCLMTVMTVTGPGLELKGPGGSFLPLEPTGELLFMSGEILNLLSGGRIPAIYHRVRSVPTLQQRMSLLFFADMSPIVCKPWISNETNDGINIGERVLKNSTRYGLAEWNFGLENV
jgi:isopenicillin N synthase-like dioxygenase